MSNGDKGYGKPPKEHQFKKGQSGNPTGKKKGTNKFKSLSHILRDTLLPEIDVSTNGKHQKMPRLAAVVTVQLNEAMKGNTQAAKFLVALAEKHVPTHQSLEELMASRPVYEFTEEDQERFSKAKLIEGMALAEAVKARSEPEYLEPGDAANSGGDVSPEPKQGDHKE